MSGGDTRFCKVDYRIRGKFIIPLVSSYRSLENLVNIEGELCVPILNESDVEGEALILEKSASVFTNLNFEHLTVKSRIVLENLIEDMMEDCQVMIVRCHEDIFELEAGGGAKLGDEVRGL